MALGEGARLVFDQAAISHLLNGAHGPVGLALERAAIRVESRAKIYATGYGGGPRVRTGRLRGSITHVVVTEGGELQAWVGTNVEYGLYLELGTSRMRPYPFLRPALSAI